METKVTNNLDLIKTNGQETMSSLQIAEVTGKTHKHVMRDIRNLTKQLDTEGQSRSGLTSEDFKKDYHRADRTQYKYLSEKSQNAIMDFALSDKQENELITEYVFELSLYLDGQDKKRPMYLLNKKATLLLAYGDNGCMRAKIIKRWEGLENEKVQQSPTKTLPQNYLEALKARVVSEEEKVALQAQNKEANQIIAKKETVIIEKNEIIEGLTSEIPLADMRQRIVQMVRKGGADFLGSKYKWLYDEFNRKHHINIYARMNNKNYGGSKMDFIDKELGMIPELYELTCKLFQTSYETLMKEWGKQAKRAEMHKNN